jgi:general secretion pathway protein H
MQTLATGIKPEPQARGFTLIELMVVIAIIGLASAAIMFVMPDPRGNLVSEAERFAARAAHVRDEAVLSARDTRVETTASGYGFSRQERGEWVALTAKPLKAASWSEGTKATVTAVYYDTSGLASQAQTVTLSRDGASVSVQFAVGGGINVAR